MAPVTSCETLYSNQAAPYALNQIHKIVSALFNALFVHHCILTEGRQCLVKDQGKFVLFCVCCKLSIFFSLYQNGV